MESVEAENVSVISLFSGNVKQRTMKTVEVIII